MSNEKKEDKYVGRFLESDYEKFQNDFLALLKDYKRKTERLDKIIKQSDNQQLRFLQMNEELEEYKKKLENKIEHDKIMFQKSRQAQMGEMISMIAHQWRQPLAAISSTIISIQLDQLNSNLTFDNQEKLNKFFELQNEKFERINRQVKLLSNTIDDFRNFFKPNKEKELVPITLPLTKALSMLEVGFINKNIKINKDFQTDKQIFIHQNEIVQVILNILQNSEDAFAKNGISNAKIDVSTVETDDEVSIVIKDNAGGIPDEIMPKIFDPYFSTKDEKNGTGLGLYMSRMIVEEHNSGKLIAQNEDNGVVFKIVWEKTN